MGYLDWVKDKWDEYDKNNTKQQQQKEEEQKNINSDNDGCGCLLVIIFIFVLFGFISKFGNENLDSIFCKKEFGFKGYVYAFPDDTKAKNYRLKADMYKYHNDYIVQTIYFYNGGYIDFKSCDGGNKNGEDFYCIPINDERDWTFRFYGEKVNP